MPRIYPFSTTAKTVTLTFTSSQSVTLPAGVSKLDYVTGKGADGKAGYYDSNTPRSATVDVVITNGASGGANKNSTYTWADFQNAPGAVNSINGGGNGTVYGVSYTGYKGDNSYNISLNSISFSNSVPGSASASYDSNWQFSGDLPGSMYSSSHITWTEYGAYNQPTTGQSTTAFGLTFSGGAGTSATSSTTKNVAVSPSGGTYPLSIAPGGFIVLQYTTT